MNVAEALLQIGDWDAAEAELTQAVDSDALADLEDLSCERGWLAALRGDARDGRGHAHRPARHTGRAKIPRTSA